MQIILDNMDKAKAKKATVSASRLFPVDVWRQIKLFQLGDEYWRRKFSCTVSCLPRSMVLSTWTRKWWSEWAIVPHPNVNAEALQRVTKQILVEYEALLCPGRKQLGKQETFHIVEHKKIIG